MKTLIYKPNSNGTFTTVGMNTLRGIFGSKKALANAQIGDLLVFTSDNLQEDYFYQLITKKSVKTLTKTEYELLQDCTHYSNCIHKKLGVVQS